MARYKSLAPDVRYVDLGGRSIVVRPGDIVDFGDHPAVYVQVGDHGEPALWEAAPDKTTKKTTSIIKGEE